MTNYDVIIIGGGPAGCTAGLYCSRAGLKSLLIERGAVGGQIANASLVDNYPGFPQGIPGSELASLMHQQAARYDLEIVTAEVTNITHEDSYVVSTSQGWFGTEALIIAAGSEYRKLQVPGEGRLSGHGVSYCATCDGPFYRDTEIAVVGGGNTAIQEAIYLTRFASKVTVIHRRDELRATKIVQELAFANDKIEFVWDSVVTEVIGKEGVESIKLHNKKSGQDSTLPVHGVFVLIGIIPNNEMLPADQLAMEGGFILTDREMLTNLPGVMAAGDIINKNVRQVVNGVGEGAVAAMSAEHYLAGQD